MTALFGGYGNGHGALRAVFGGDRCGGLGHPAIDGADNEKNGKSDDQKIDDGVDEIAVIERRRAGGLGGGEGVERLVAEVDKEIGEINAAKDAAERRHQHIVDERGNYFPESGADNHADSQVQNVTLASRIL